MSGPPTPVLDAEQGKFVCSGVSISAASCRTGGLPNLARATGCRLSPDRRTATVLFAATPAAGLIEDIRRNATIAVVFSLPATHRTLQIKGTDARIVPLDPGDRELAARYVDAFVAGLEPLGYPGPVVRRVLASDPDDLVAVCFTPSAGYSQTPGPEAGVPLRSGA